MRKQNIVIRPLALDAAEAQRIKVTPGITGWSRPSVHSDGGVRHLEHRGVYGSDAIQKINRLITVDSIRANHENSMVTYMYGQYRGKSYLITEICHR